MEFKRLRDLREDADLTQEKLGEALNLSQRTYSYYEKGERAVPIEVFIDLAKYYNVSIDYIVELTENPDKFW